MTSVVRTRSPLISSKNKTSPLRFSSSRTLANGGVVKRVSSDGLTTQAVPSDWSEHDLGHITDHDKTPAPGDRLKASAASPRMPSDRSKIGLSSLAVDSCDLSRLTDTSDDGEMHTALNEDLSRLAMQDAASVQASPLKPPVCDKTTSTGVPKSRISGDVPDRSNTIPLRPATVAKPGWQVTATFESAFMTNLGKGRLLARQVEVPLEAKARFAQIKNILEADVKKLITGISSRNQILWSHRICMVGSKSGTTVITEPTILITCGSQKCRRKVKDSLLRIRPHYLENLGMTLIVRYDKFAPVLAGLNGSLSKANKECSQQPLTIIRIQWPPSTTSCGLKIMIEFRYAQTLRRGYATLGGVIKVGGVWYGLTTAHPIFDYPPNLLEADLLDDSDCTSESSDFSDSSDADVLQKSCQDLQNNSEADLLDISRTLGFTRLAGGQPEDLLAYSFDGEHKSSSGSVTMEDMVSDWAVIELPEAYIRPNICIQPVETSEETERLVSLNSVASQTEMSSGTVHILCNQERPYTGYLNMNPVSLQLKSGAMDVHEVFPEKALSSGVSGSWVVKENQVVGMVVAISNGGSSCYILPIWKVFESIQTVCGQEVQFCELPSSSAASSGSYSALAKQFRTDQITKSVQINPANIGSSEQESIIQTDQYNDLMSRMVRSQELIAKALSILASPGPVLGRFLDSDEKSEAFTNVSSADPTFGSAPRILKPSDSLSQSSTYVATMRRDLNDDEIGLYAETGLPIQYLDEEDLLKHVISPIWISQSPQVLRELLDWHSLRVRDITSLTFDQEPKSRNTILECYDIDGKGAANLLDTRSETSKFAPWSALAVTRIAKRSVNVVGKMIISKDPTALHLAALHLVLNKDFDMSSILHMLVDESPSTCYMKGYLEPEIVKQRSFVFSFKYHCIIGAGCKPLPWQKSGQSSTVSDYGLSLSTCSSVVCLSLSESSKQFSRRKSHRDQAMTVHIFDPLGPWKLLKIQCFPDRISGLEDYESDSTFTNGPEAFVTALLAEYRDAVSRYRELYRRISNLVLPPTNLIFDSKLRDKLLFETSHYTLSRRYFWANQVLKLISKEIDDMISACAQSLTDKVWKGEHRYIWPGVSEASSEFYVWRQKMLSIRKELDYEISQLQLVRSQNSLLQKDIDALRSQLFTGLAVEESRKLIKDSNSMKALAILTFMFLPVTLVSTFLGMRFFHSGNSLPTNTSSYVFVCAAILIGLTSLMFNDIRSILRQFWSALKAWMIREVSFVSFIMSLRLRLTDTLAGDLLEAIRKQIKPPPEDEALPEGLRRLWFDRRDPQQLYIFKAVVLIGLLTIALSIIQLVLNIMQLYHS